MHVYNTSYIPQSTIGLIGLGYIGSNIARFIKENAPQADLIVLNRHNWRGIASEREFDYFINATGFSGNFRERPVDNVDLNISLTIELLSKIKITQAYLAMSSTRVYGFRSSRQPCHEEDALVCLKADDINTMYDGAKILMESIVLHHGRNNAAFRSIVARLSNVYGRFDRLDDTTLIKKLVRLSGSQEVCHVPQNALSSKDYVYIDDAVDGLLRALTVSTESTVYNIASGSSYSLAEIADILNVQIVTNDALPESHSNISTEKARLDLGYEPCYSIHEGLIADIKESLS